MIFLTRLRRKMCFKELGLLYGCGEATASDYFWELVELFHEALVPNLLFPRTPQELKEMSRKEVLEAFPDLLYLIDATNWQMQKPENFLYNRMTWSAYKSFNAFQAVLCKFFIVSGYSEFSLAFF